jgi:hypothetical protein
MLIVLFHRYVCVIAASDVFFFCVVLLGLSLHVNCIRLHELFTNYGILIMWVGYICGRFINALFKLWIY